MIYNMPEMTPYAKLLLETYLDLQKKQNRYITNKDFADIMGVGEITMNLLKNGKRKKPSYKTAHTMYLKTGDRRFMELAGFTVPADQQSEISQELSRLNNAWQFVPDERRHQIAEEVEKYKEKARNENASENPATKNS